MSCINVAVVEDEKEYADLLVGYIEKYFSSTNKNFDVCTFNSAEEFFGEFAKSKYHVIFMDIKMSGMSGVNAATLIRKTDSAVLLFFVTSLAKYALKGYEVSAFDFMLKPVSYYNFALKMDRAVVELDKLFKRKAMVQITNDKTVLVSKIIYVEVYKHQLTYHTKYGDFSVANEAISHAYTKLKPYNFAFCNRCYLVNLEHVTGINKTDLYVGDEVLKIANSRKNEFLRELNNYLSSEGD